MLLLWRRMVGVGVAEVVGRVSGVVLLGMNSLSLMRLLRRLACLQGLACHQRCNLLARLQLRKGGLVDLKHARAARRRLGLAGACTKVRARAVL